MARVILVLVLVLCAATAAAIQGKYPLSGIRNSPGASVAASTPAVTTGCVFGSATFPCDF